MYKRKPVVASIGLGKKPWPEQKFGGPSAEGSSKYTPYNTYKAVSFLRPLRWRLFGHLVGHYFKEASGQGSSELRVAVIPCERKDETSNRDPIILSVPDITKVQMIRNISCMYLGKPIYIYVARGHDPGDAPPLRINISEDIVQTAK